MPNNNSSAYRFAFDLGTSSLGWAVFKIQKNNLEQWQPFALVKSGVRIFSDGRNPKDGSSLAVTRREARSARRRRDRLLKRKARMLSLLIKHGFFPQDELKRKEHELLNPYQMRAEGLSRALKPYEFARAIFHLTQRRGFKSNRKTDAKDSEAGLMNTAIKQTQDRLAQANARTIGELLYKRMCAGKSVRARFHQTPEKQADGRNKINKSYDLYINRKMVEDEFDLLWQTQTSFNPLLYHAHAYNALKECLFHQRPLKPVDPGRCTLLSDEKRAPLALPSAQRFRMYQEVNNLRFLDAHQQEQALPLEQRDKIIQALEKTRKLTFDQIRKKILKISGNTTFNLEDEKRTELKGNLTSAELGNKKYFGDAWYAFTPELQDNIVMQLLNEESEQTLIQWLQNHTGINEVQAEQIANARLPDGYGSLSAKALALILPKLQENVITYNQAVVAAGFEHHSHISHAEQTGEILPELPYYGEYLQRHVGFGTNDPKDPPEKRFGRIANPTVHIGLNQLRLVTNALIKRYGHPEEIIVEIARELKQSKKERDEKHRRQAVNQKRNERLREEIANLLGIAEQNVKYDDVQKMILWEELNPHDPIDRKCPYSGVQISLSMLFSDAVEIEHILPYAQTLDDSLNNKTVAMRQANRIKRDRTPWDARADFEQQGWDFEGMMHRVMFMSKNKRYRFAEGALQKWLRDDKDFLARALNDTRYLSRIAREYLTLVCPLDRTKQNVRVIPGQMTAKLRHQFGLNHILGLEGLKNRDDHRHHAVDACVIGVTDAAMLQKITKAYQKEMHYSIDKTKEEKIPLPWPTYQDQVKRAINSIKVSHRPDHGYQSGMHNDTAYGLAGNGIVYTHKRDENNKRIHQEEKLSVIPFTHKQAKALKNGKLVPRHGILPDGSPKPYKGYKGDSNYCMEITCNEKGKWESRVISTFEVYQFVRQHGEQIAFEKLKNTKQSLLDGNPIIMRLIRNDCVRFEQASQMQYMRVVKLTGNGDIYFAPIHEANVDARNRDKENSFKYVTKTAGSLQKAKGRRITISPIGEVTDKRFKT